ncbi:hypothetical protein F2P56_006724 [Juglans regia]|uniref:SEP domain-containing protein n=1 Tax=Juglans regia TaxID=51240 RepID=A0A833Y073_JUGRE|nr:hypothetical protein F2P56_006724 [Juglans regia]
MSSRDKKPSKPSSSRTGGIRTLSDLNRPSADSDSDSDGPQEYYTGGEKSGMLVQDPSKANDVDAIFNQARQLGAVEGPVEQLRPSSSSSNFTGTGRLLSGETVQTAPQQPENVVHNIVFWSNGFTVNDGPLRSLDDPENAAFLEVIAIVVLNSLKNYTNKIVVFTCLFSLLFFFSPYVKTSESNPASKMAAVAT